MQSNDSNIPAFPAFPCTSRYVALGAIEDAVARVSRAIDARESAALVIGPPGTGKSLLCGLITQQYQSTHQVVVLGETPLEDRDMMLRHLLHRLGVDPSAFQAADPHLALDDYLVDPSRQDEGLIMIVDEAQKLSADVIEAIRMVTNITRNGEPRVFALLCGGVKLDETLVDASLESFTQRAGTRCYLHPMNAEETRYFIHQTISNCGADPESTITDEAIATIHHACSGVPRLINQLISQAIDCAAEADEILITEQFVDSAWAQLQQLPSPMIEEPTMTMEASPIEFGELDDSCNTVQWTDDETGGYNVPTTEQPTDQESAAFHTEACESVSCESDSESGGNGIKLESSTAIWVDDPVAESHTKRLPQPDALFGQFDHEEEISVGSGFATRGQATATAPANLEMLLQQEIVGVGSRPEDVAVDDEPEVIQIHPADTQSRVTDDSDLLVIEDEVAVLPIDGGNTDGREVQAVSVDFQAMLAKMRGAH